MQQLVLIVTAAALLSAECSPSNVDRPNKLLSDLNNNIQTNGGSIENSPRPPARARRFVSLTRQPHHVTALAPGSAVELTCEAIGAPAPHIHWFKNDAPVYHHEVGVSTHAAPSSVGRVVSTVLVSRAGRYTCVAAAGGHTARANTTVYSTDGSIDLSERSKLAPLAPRIVVTYKVLMDTIGNNIVLPCKVKGHPKPHVSWTDNQGMPVKENPRIKVLRSGELVITSLRWSDMGEFTCFANNVFGTESVDTFVYPVKAG